MNPTLQGYTAAIVESAGSGALASLAIDLEAVTQLVETNATLNSALTDTTVPGPARRAVMLDLLDGKVSEQARRLAAFATSAVRAPDVPAALAWVTTRTRHAAEGQDYEELPLSLMEARSRVGGFAAAVQEDSSTAELEGTEDDLFRFARIVDSTPALRSALIDRDLDVSARQALVTQLLEGKVGAGSLALGALRHCRRASPRHCRHSELAGRTNRQGSGLANRPSSVGRSHRGGTADHPFRFAGSIGRGAGGTSSRD